MENSVHSIFQGISWIRFSKTILNYAFTRCFWSPFSSFTKLHMFLFHKENLGLREELRETIHNFISNLIVEAGHKLLWWLYHMWINFRVEEILQFCLEYFSQVSFVFWYFPSVVKEWLTSFITKEISIHQMSENIYVVLQIK